MKFIPRLLFICLSVLLLTQNSSAQVTLYGTVKGATGTAQSGVTVWLVKTNLRATTAADGTFLITNASAVFNPVVNNPAAGFSIVNNTLVIRSDHPVPLTVSLFDLTGKKIKDIYTGPSIVPVVEKKLGSDQWPMQSAVLTITVDGVATAVPIVLGGHISMGRFTPPQTKAVAFKAALPKKNLTLSILDTLKATFGTSSIRLHVYNWIDTMDFVLGESDTLSEARQQVVHRINTYRSSLGLAALTRRTDKNSCLDSQALLDGAGNSAHSAFGRCGESAQNECPGWNTIASIYTPTMLAPCLQMMWDEGPPPSNPCTSTCFQTYGHFITMSNPLYKNPGYPTYTRVSCGFARAANGKYWCVQDFW